MHSGEVRSVRFSPSAYYLLSARWEKNISSQQGGYLADHCADHAGVGVADAGVNADADHAGVADVTDHADV